MARATRAVPTPPFDWPMKPLGSAETRWRELPDRRLEVVIRHDTVRGVTPAMLAWWFRHIPGTMDFHGARRSRYTVWHPRDHIAHEVARLAPDGTVGPGAHFHIVEAFGGDPAYYVDTIVRVEKLDETGVALARRALGRAIFRIEHEFAPVPEGTRYVTRARVGLEAPLGGALLNRAVRPRFFPEGLARALVRHAVEEVGNFELFLPALYGACADGDARC